MHRYAVRFALIVGIFLFKDAASPTSLYACIFKVTDNQYCRGVPCPYPPCLKEDVPYRKRIDQFNSQMLGKMASTAVGVAFVMKEIEQWKELYSNSVNWRDTFTQYWGRLSANPLPRLANSWNNTNLSLLMTLDYKGGLRVDGEVVDVGMLADSMYALMQEQTNLSRLYDYGQQTAGQIEGRIKSEADYTSEIVLGEVKAMMDHQQYLRIVSDSLRNTGRELGDRYADEELGARGDGDAEASIVQMSAGMTRAKGSAFEMQLRAQQARNQALLFSLESAEIYKREYARKRRFEY